MIIAVDSAYIGQNAAVNNHAKDDCRLSFPAIED